MFIAACLTSAGAHAQPTIATQPANQNLFPGGTAVFSVAASGAGLLTYQWQFQGTNLPASLMTIEAGDGYSGYYGDGGPATNAELNLPEGIAFDATGNLYIADTANSLVRKVAVNGNISTVAGNGTPAYRGDGGPAAKASLNQPESVAVDPAGNLYIADTLNSVIRKVNAAGIITTFAGNGRYAYAGDGGRATKAALNQPSGVAVDSGGNLYIADTLNSVVRKVNAGGDIATVAGDGTSAYSGDGGPATRAALNQPAGVAVDPWGNLYIADTLNSVVRKVNASGAITTVAGNGTNAYGGDGGAATNASLSQPAFVTLDSSGNLYIADSGNDVVRQVTATGLINTVAGGGSQSPQFADEATNASLLGTGGLAFRGAGHLYIGDPGDAFVCQVVLDYSQGATLSLSDVNSNNAGAYDVVVSDGSESVLSSNAILTLEPTFVQSYFPLAVDTMLAFDVTNSLNLAIIYQGDYLMTESYPGVYEALDLDADANSVSLVEAGTGWVHASFNPPALLLDNAALQNGGTLTTSTRSEGYAATYSVSIGKAGTMTVPAGTFYNCRSFTASESLDGRHATALTAYLAPGVGIIKLLVKSGDWAELTGGTVNGNDVSAYAGMPLATTSPTLSITSPKSGLVASNDVLTVTGSAADAVAVQSVYYQLNGGSWALATSSNSWTHWSAAMTLVPGANTILVYSMDSGGLVSAPSELQVHYVPRAPLTLVAQGSGSVPPVDNGKWLAIGSNYTVTAQPGRNWVFSNWVGGTPAPYGVVGTTAALTFLMESNLFLQANFVTNAFLAAQGTYVGLFAVTNAAREQTNSGGFTLKLMGTGSFTGTLSLGPDTSSLPGDFSIGGVAQVVSTRKNKPSLTTTLQLDFASQTVTGNVSDGSFVASLNGFRNEFSTANPARGLAGQYTVVIPGASQAAVGPYGTSHGTVSVSAAGVVNFTGSLADGTTGLSQSGAVSPEGWWPLYVPLYGGTGSLWGWGGISNQDIMGTLSWINTTNASKSAVYRSGFTNQTAELFGSSYNGAARPLLGSSSGQVVLEEGEPYPFSITNQVDIGANGAVTVINPPHNPYKLSVKINAANGVVSGTFVNPTNSTRSIPFNGVLLQNQTNAAGYFLETNQSGSFSLQTP